MSLYIEVITRDLEDDEKSPERKIINFKRHQDRVWLTNHSFWCMHNRHSVLTRPMEDPA